MREAVREKWTLPQDSEFKRSGPDWVLLSLSKEKEECRAKLMLVWWRAWHWRNDIIFSKGDASVTASAHFLFSYADAMICLRDHIPAPDLKGKKPLFSDSSGNQPPIVTKNSEWTRPDSGWAKLNVDASYIQ